MDISPELVERCVALVRQMASAHPDSMLGDSTYGADARAIAAELPKPVDPDLLEAREIAASIGEGRGYAPFWRAQALRGELDQNEYVLGALAGIKRGRELANEERSS